ncbi:MAG: hypothetical protein O7D34_01175 [Ignavibacteria bacterium]|nr:hypothetical protein [Ignavibacteria bacterium]
MGPKATPLTLVVILSLNVPNFLLYAQPTYNVDVIGRIWFPSQVGSDTTDGTAGVIQPQMAPNTP